MVPIYLTQEMFKIYTVPEVLVSCFAVVDENDDVMEMMTLMMMMTLKMMMLNKMSNIMS
jgi:hypothetical protein